MVGARELGEFAWSIENLLNRLLDGTLTRSPAILETLREAVALLPQLVVELGGRPAAAALVAGACWSRARTRWPPAAKRRVADAAAASAAAPSAALRRAAPRQPSRAEPAPRRAATPPAVPPPEPRGCAARRRSRHAEQRRRRCATSTRARPPATSPTVRAWLQREQPLPGAARADRGGLPRLPHAVRQLAMAEARHGIRLAEPLNHWLRKSFDSGVGLTTPTWRCSATA